MNRTAVKKSVSPAFITQGRAFFTLGVGTKWVVNDSFWFAIYGQAISSFAVSASLRACRRQMDR